MIVKKVPTSKVAAAKTRAANVRALCDYIAGAAAGSNGEKIEHRGALNLLNVDHENQVQEMIDLAELAKRDALPVRHWIISWREGEQPTPAQADEAVRILLGEMGLRENQAIYALHRDTHNCHLHVAVNRVHPDTEKLVTVNGGFDHEVAHRAIARIEKEQGWQREANGLFLVLPEGRIARLRARSEGERRPSVRALSREEQTGERSAERIAIEDGAPIIRRAGSWRELHEGLARKQIRFEKKGSGAVIWIGQQAVKASTAGRDCSMAALEKRLGPYVDGPLLDLREAGPRRSEPIEHRSAEWTAYRAEREAHYTARATGRDRTAAGQRAEWRRLAERHRRERDDVFHHSWKGRGDALNATRSVLAMRQAQEKAELRDRHCRERADLRKTRARFPSYEEWLRRRSRERADEWRHRERWGSMIEGPTFEPPAPRDIRAFGAVVDIGCVHYHLLGARGIAAFTDRGKRIDIRDVRKEAVLAALQLSAQKWATFTVHGGERFKRMCVDLAAEHGFQIANPELREAIAAERQHKVGERQRESAITRHQGTERPPVRERPPVQSLAEAYHRHLLAVRQDQPRADVSRVDGEIAVRLQLNGYSRREVAKAIAMGAATDRPNERRDWTAYAERTVAFAFGTAGKRIGERIRAQMDRLLSVEGRRQQDVDHSLESRGS
jgi:hypothetical protein